MRQLKVYGWQSFRYAAPRRGQTREIIAARSKSEAARLAGYSRPSVMFNLSETGNKPEIDQAMSAPGTVFWRAIDDYKGPWTAAEGTFR